MGKSKSRSFLIDDWRVSPPEGLLTRGGELVRLEPKAMEVLVYLASRPGEVITREELERDVWHGALVGYDAVTNTVIKLRKALQDSARHPRFIATIPKMGYQLIASTTYLGDDENAGSHHGSRESTAGASRATPSRSVLRAVWATAGVVGMLVVGLVWFWPSTASIAPVESKKSDALPSVVVLPFENLSGDPRQDYLADGITEDIITDLSRLSNMLVLASDTSRAYEGRRVAVEEIGADLNVGFVLKGSVRQIGDAVRVNAQLVNTATGFNVWAQRYDRRLSEVFAVQNEVTRSIVSALSVKVTNLEKNRLARRTTDNLKAYDFFQEGQRLSKVSTKETNQQAREVYRKAIELDPGYGRAYSALAVTLAIDFLWGWTDAPLETLNRAFELAKKAVVLDDSTPQTYWALGFVHLMRKEYEAAEKAAIQAVTIAPNYADGYGLLALITAYTGKPERAIELITKGMRLSPYYSWEYLYVLGTAYYMLGDYDAAIAILEKAQERNENAVQVKLFLAASYVKANRQGDAEWLAVELQALNPAASVTSIEKTIQISPPAFKRAFFDDLRKAGLPE